MQSHVRFTALVIFLHYLHFIIGGVLITDTKCVESLYVGNNTLVLIDSTIVLKEEGGHFTYAGLYWITNVNFFTTGM